MMGCPGAGVHADPENGGEPRLNGGFGRSGGRPDASLCVTQPGNGNVAPILDVSPASIATDYTGTVQIEVGSVSGSSTILRLHVDANANGVIDAPADRVVWTDIIEDNVADWSPNLFSDTDGAVGDCDDNCPFNANPGQEDADSDGIGDLCDVN